MPLGLLQHQPNPDGTHSINMLGCIEILRFGALCQGQADVDWVLPLVGGLLVWTSSASPSSGDMQFEFVVRGGSVQLRTRIRDYRSALIGSGKVPPRRWLYMSTQRLFHAFVMARYHRWVAANLGAAD